MDKFLIAAAVLLFSFGALLLFRPAIVKKVDDWLNTIVFPVDDKMRSSSAVSGMILVILGVIVLYLAMKH